MTYVSASRPRVRIGESGYRARIYSHQCVFFMSITLAEARELVSDTGMSDEELQNAVDACKALAKLVIEKALKDRLKKV